MVVLILSWRPRRPTGAVKRTWYGKMFVKNLYNLTFWFYWPHWPVCSISDSRAWSKCIYLSPLENLTGLRHSRNFYLLRKLKLHYCFHVNPNFCHILSRMNPLMHASTHAHSHTLTRTHVCESLTAILPSYSGLGLLISFFPSVIGNVNLYTDYASLPWVLHYFSISVPLHHCLNIW
jgi:hypothetical protein